MKDFDKENMKKTHPEWFSATDYHWMDKGKHDFWSESLSTCDYSPEMGIYSLFEKRKDEMKEYERLKAKFER